MSDTSTTKGSAFDPVPDQVSVLLDPEWLAHALDLVGDDEEVTAVERFGGSRTVAEKVHFAVTVGGPQGTQVHPLVAKGHFGDGFNSLATEAHAYRDLLPQVSVRTPVAHHAGVDDEGGRGLIVMDDVIALGGRILDARSPYPVATCRDSLSQLAVLHAGTWGDERWDVPWLGSRIADMATMFPADRLQSLLDDGRGPELPPVLRDAGALQAAMARTAELPTTCVLHGDTHSGNAFLDAEGRACWFDWQITQRGCWAVDIAYHLGTVLDVEVRRAHERGLLQHYLDELRRHGVDTPTFDDAWELYTLAFTWGYFLWTITSISSREVVLLHVPRLGAALDDHDTYRRLGVA
jgi:hypothetical protein